jgi:DNA polymerase III delta subunit
VYTFFLNKNLKVNTLIPCYFFYGEETYLAFQFINDLKQAIISPEVEDYEVERFNLEEHSWAEVLDVARTMPFLLSPVRLIVVEIPKGKRNNLSAGEGKILDDYFSSPSLKTVLVVIYMGKIEKGSPLFKFFSSLPPSTVHLKELRPLKERALFSWMEKKLSLCGKIATHDAKTKLAELTGNDLRRVDNEIEKIITFVGEKKVIEEDDVNQITGWIRTFLEWEISESLSRADSRQCIIVLNNLLRKEGVKPGAILGSMTKFFRDIFLAKLWLQDKDKERKAIFRELRPQIQEKFGKFYSEKFQEFFTLVDKFSLKDLSYFLGQLEKVDLKMKSTDISSQVLLESFLFEYCQIRKKNRITLKERG